MPRPVMIESRAPVKNQDADGPALGWVAGIDILWSGEDSYLSKAVQVYGESAYEAKARAEWVLDAINAAMGREKPPSELHTFVDTPWAGDDYPYCYVCGVHRSQHHEEES